MKLSALKFVALLLLATAVLSFDVPKGWYKAGSQPDKYDMGTDKGAGMNGKNAATIKSIDDNVTGFGTLMQSCPAGKYLGKRVKMTGYMKSANVKSWAGFWFRVDQAGSDTPLSFDNMEDRAIKGSTGWKQYEIVLDVPANASVLAFGALMDGTGQIWFDDIKFEIVSKKVPLTGTMDKGPQNLNFER